MTIRLLRQVFALSVLSLLAGGVASGCSSDGQSQKPGASTGYSDSCSDDSACDSANGFRCIDGSCRVRCDSHFDCAAVGYCQSVADASYCADDTPANAGEYYERCPNGDADCGADFVCQSAGPGDFDAYCTSDCSADDDCPRGFRCGARNETPCEDACGQRGQHSATCIASADIGPGKRYDCGEPFGVVRHVCERRSFCDSCETDEDCLGVPGQICARDASGEKICTQPCDPSVDACPWGNATECGLWDSERGIYTCSHRFGSCHGTGAGCEPCRDGSDCSASGFCTSATFTGEQFCIDLSVSCDCGSDADASGVCTGHGCPDTPGGLPMQCFSAERYAGDPLAHRCIGASSTASVFSSPQAGCWAKP